MEKSDSRILYPLWSVGAIAATGGIFAATMLLALNYRSLQKVDAAWTIVILGMAVGMLELSGFMYFGVPKSELFEIVMRLTHGICLYICAIKLQGSSLKEHLQAGGALASVWRVVGVGLLGIFIFVLTISTVAVIWAVLSHKVPL